MPTAQSRVRRSSLLLAIALVAGALTACDTPSAPLAPDASIEQTAPNFQNTEEDSTTKGGRSGWTDPHG